MVYYGMSHAVRRAMSKNKRISFSVLSARMTNPSSSTSRGDFYMNGSTRVQTQRQITTAGSAAQRQKTLQPV